MLIGITNPRNVEPTGPFRIITYDIDGISRIDFGFDIDTKMSDLSVIDGFTVTSGSNVNGATSIYTFSFSSSVTIINGDVIQFTFPDEIVLPGIDTDFNITPVPRTVGGIVVYDDLKIESTG